MAIFKTSPIVGAISGTIGGLQFSFGPKGPVVGVRGARTNAFSSRQLSARALYLSIAHLWRAVSSADRDWWATIARHFPLTNRFGIRRPQSGFQLFMSTNIRDPNFDGSGNVIPVEPLANPIQANPPATMSLDFTSGTGRQITFSPAGSNWDWFIILGARSGSDKPATTFRRWLRIGKIDPLQFPFISSTQWDPVLGAPLLGERIAVRAIGIKTGQFPAPLLEAQTLVVAP